LVEGAVAQHGEQHVAASSGKGNERLIVALALLDFARVIVPRDWISQGSKGREEERFLEYLVAPPGRAFATDGLRDLDRRLDRARAPGEVDRVAQREPLEHRVRARLSASSVSISPPACLGLSLHSSSRLFSAGHYSDCRFGRFSGNPRLLNWRFFCCSGGVLHASLMAFSPTGSFSDMLRLPNLVRTLTTAVVMLSILAAKYALWVRYQIEPLTRDGKVRADVVPIAPDVSGLVTEVHVHDNEVVRKGQVLFVIDPSRYRIALERAEADVQKQRAEFNEATRKDRRNRSMPDVIATESTEQGMARAEQLHAVVKQAKAARDLAALNLERTFVRALVDGTVTNMDMQPGVYLNAGKAAMALVSAQSLRVEAYFEETKLPAVNVGDRASIYLMGVANEIHGHVESIAGGVEDRERTGSDAQLANVNPSFTWVRLAQRIPVRIAVDSVPPGVQLIPGQTASVEVHLRSGEVMVKRSLPW
jgi:RND family efflux transporter MFP subunit